MARIRSIHPGFFTDEDFVSVGMSARLLFLGLGVQADDKGIFEWKPLTLKMRIFPGDNVDLQAMLVELEEVGAIRRFTFGEKTYGAIRNFRKFQKPKTPNDIYPAPAEILRFVGLISENDSDEEASFPPKGETLPQKGEKPFQMEDGGGRMEKESNTTSPSRSGRGGAYAFLGKVIKLNAKDLERWRKTYHSIADLEAELSSIDVWWTSQPREKQDKWFHATTNMLNKRHQERLAAQKAEQVRPVMLGP